MLITIAVIFILSTFLLIMYNMYSDYQARKEADIKTMSSKAKNVVSDTEELLLNQSQLPYSRVIILILRHRIINALKKLKEDPSIKNLDQKIADQYKQIADLKNYKDDLSFKNPENDRVAVAQLRQIRRLRKIIHQELRSGTPVDAVSCQKEDRRLQLLVLKVNISNLLQTVNEMKRLHQNGTCRQLIEKGLEAIKVAPIKDEWIIEKGEYLKQVASELDADVKKVVQKSQAKADKKESATKSEIDQLFADKKKW